jgi:DNA-binding transcriptional MocR family regulator
MSLERRKEIVAIAERYGVPIVEDNMLGPMMPYPIPPIKCLAPHRCFLVSSATKILCPGLKIGFVVPPEGSYKVTMDCLRAMSVRVPPLVADVFTHLINSPDAQRTIDEARHEAGNRQKLAEEILPEENAVCDAASYYVWMPLPSHWTSSSFAVRYLIGPVPNKVQLGIELEVLAGLIREEPARDIH